MSLQDERSTKLEGCVPMTKVCDVEIESQIDVLEHRIIE